MPDPLVARLLGPPQFSVAANSIACPSKKSLGLFAFLLLTGKQHPRRELAALLWGHGDEETSRASLRAALHRLPAAMAECLQIDRESIGVAPSAAPLVDVERFETLARAQDLDSLETAATLYQDELLKDFEPAATPEFDDWLHGGRVRLGQLAQNVFDGVIARRTERARQDAARATSERESALATGLRWTSLMPGAEAGHRWLMRLYLDMGQRDAALAQYELCQRFLAVTHGRAPSTETRELQEMALAGGARAPRARAATSAAGDFAIGGQVDGAAIAATSFVGRLEELAELDRLFADPTCRLITLHGLGGAGKTRLAHAFATQVGPRFAQGVSWVALETANSSDDLPASIADRLGRDIPRRGDRVAAVAAMLARQQRLLVLDNFETLIGAGREQDGAAQEMVLRLLQAAPRLRIVVTSREVLGLQEEWVYEVRGLGDGQSGSSSGESAPAIELFAQRARQAYLGFSLSAEMPHVLRICGLVEGLPLGIELAAAWVRTIPCADIAAAIEAEAGGLASAHRNRPGRHQSLDAVVACSWKLLSDEQQQALAGLGVFVGGFTRSAAEHVAAAPLRMLSALADKSLVRRRTEGRYDLHELVRQFAQARLRDSRTRYVAATKRHADHFAALLLQVFVDLRGPDEVAADALLRSELPNMLAAWSRSVDAGRLDIVERMAAPLIALLHTRGLVPQALAEAARAVDAMRKSGRNDVLAMVRLQWGRAAVTGGQPDVARRELDAALAEARNGGKPDVIARCLYYRGTFDYQQAAVDEGTRVADEALALAAHSEDAELRALVHNLRGSIANLRSEFDLAERLLRIGLAAAREQGAPSLIAGMLGSLAVPLYYQGKLAESAALTTEAARLYEMLGRNATAITVRGNLAAISLAQGELALAREHAEIAERLARESGEEDALPQGLATLGDVLFQQGEHAMARTALDESVRLAEAIGKPLQLTEALYLLACIDLHENRRERSLANIIRLRDVLSENRLDVRAPMLILATAQWAVSSGDKNKADAFRWLGALGRLDDIDSTLRNKARQLLADEGITAGAEASPSEAGPSLAQLEREVVAFLAHASHEKEPD